MKPIANDYVLHLCVINDDDRPISTKVFLAFSQVYFRCHKFTSKRIMERNTDARNGSQNSRVNLWSWMSMSLLFTWHVFNSRRIVIILFTSPQYRPVAMHPVVSAAPMRWRAIRHVYKTGCWGWWLRQRSAVMENSSLPSDVLNNSTASLLEDDDITPNVFSVRELVLQIVYTTIGIVGVLDNLFVIIIFIFFIKITDKVLST